MNLLSVLKKNIAGAAYRKKHLFIVSALLSDVNATRYKHGNVLHFITAVGSRNLIDHYNKLRITELYSCIKVKPKQITQLKNNFSETCLKMVERYVIQEKIYNFNK